MNFLDRYGCLRHVISRAQRSAKLVDERLFSTACLSRDEWERPPMQRPRRPGLLSRLHADTALKHHKAGDERYDRADGRCLGRQ